MSPIVFFDATLLGLEYSLLAVGIYITFRILNMADLTVDGSFCLGMAVSAIFTISNMPHLGLLFGACAGALAGIVTGLLATKAKINPLIAGIITSTGLYSINIYVLGSPNISLLGIDKMYNFIMSFMAPNPHITNSSLAFQGGKGIGPEDISKLISVLAIVIIIIALLIAYFKTESGLAMRAVGDNEAMSAASSINVDITKIGGLALGNALVGLSGAILAQCQGFADMSSGTGMVMIGLACVIIGEVCGGRKSVVAGLVCTVIGSIVYRIIIQIALGINILDANALKLISSLIVAAFMAFPAIKSAIQNKRTRSSGSLPYSQ